jgi:VanZ family protein
MTYEGRGIDRVFLAMLAYAAALEFLQRFSPGRDPSLGDFLFSAAGMLAGLAVFFCLRRLLQT